jgi:hypothetical protein
MANKTTTILKGCGDMSISTLKENDCLTNSVRTDSVVKLLNHIALQTQSIECKLTIMIDNHIAQKLQNYNHEVVNKLSCMGNLSKK